MVDSPNDQANTADGVTPSDTQTRLEHSGGRSTPSLEDRGFFGHPAGLGTLFNAELWERFSYYGMRAILAYYLYDTVANGGLAINETTALAIVSTYGATVYLLSVVGGWLADRVIGPFRGILYGGVVIMAGHMSLAMPVAFMSWVGISLVAFGTGLLKPNVSTVVGQLYDPEDGRRDAGFSIFYVSINIGSFFAPLVVSFLQSRWGYHAGFSAAAVGMAFGLIALVVFRKNLRGAGSHVPNPIRPGELPRIAVPVGIGTLVVAAVFGLFFVLNDQATDAVINAITTLSVLASIGVFVVMFASKKVTPNERSHLKAYVPLWIGAMLFWMIFEQAASKMAYFAEKRTDLGSLFGYDVKPADFQSINALCVVLLAPLFAILWQRRAGKFPSTATKFAFGVLLAGLSFVLLAFWSHVWPNGATAPMFALASVFVVQTIGELCLSPVGLSATTKLAPAVFGSQAMALWFLTSAAGQSLAAQAIRLMDDLSDMEFYLTLGGATACFSLVLFAFAPWIKRHMADVDANVATTENEVAHT